MNLRVGYDVHELMHGRWRSKGQGARTPGPWGYVNMYAHTTTDFYLFPISVEFDSSCTHLKPIY
jgi:hypothetical protein